MVRWSEEEAIHAGWRKDSKGNWHEPGKTNIQCSNPGKVPKLESGNLGVKKRVDEPESHFPKGCGGRYRIIVTASCRRHTDPDNLCPKWFVDQLKVFGIIPDDSSEFIEEFVKRVKKVESWEPEVTQIDVYKIGE